jgi:hypothetical protein
MKKLFSTLLLFLLCGFSFENTNKMPIDKEKFFIKELNYRDLSFGKVSDWVNFWDKLQLVDSCDYIYVKEREHCSSSEYYYYAIIDTTNYYSYVYFYFHEYIQAFVLVNYDKKGNYIDDVLISSTGGDWGWSSYSDGLFVDDSTIIRTDTEEKIVEWTPESTIFDYTITSLIRYKIVLKEDGHIQKDTLRQYIPCK